MSSSSTSDEMRIMFIHSGKEYFKNLGPHYGPLIKHSLSLLPITQYLRLNSIRDKDKHRAIQALPTGSIIGVALFDKSFWFNASQSHNPWAHGPYCYHIKDAFRIDKPIKCRGLPGIWPMDKNIRNTIQSMPRVQAKLSQWKRTYKISNKSESCLTVMQPFAEAIIRKIKTIENRQSKLFLLSSNDGEFTGCRLCVNTNNNHQNTQSIVDNSNHNKHIPKYTKHTDFRYHRSATLTECQCKKTKAYKRLNKVKKSDKKIETKQRRKKRKLNLKPLPDYNGMSTRRKPSKKRRLNKVINYGTYYDKDRYNFRHKKKTNTCYNELVEMGFDAEHAEQAKTCANVSDGVDYIQNMQCVKTDVSLGYSEQLKHKKKRKREHNHNHNHMKRKENYSEYEEILDNDYDEDMAIQQAMKASQSSYVEESKWMSHRTNYNVNVRKQKLPSETIHGIPRRRCE
eukprot:211251_1